MWHWAWVSLVSSSTSLLELTHIPSFEAIELAASDLEKMLTVQAAVKASSVISVLTASI